MSTAEILSLISLISYIVSGVCLLLAVFFWFYFKIPSVIGDLSGRNARKSIARMRASNEQSSGKGYKPSAANVNRGKLTDTMQHSRKLTEEQKKKTAAEDQMPETGLLASNKAKSSDGQQTELLDGVEATALLNEEEATAPLHEEKSQPVKRTGGKKLTMLDEVMLVHTDEVIE